MKSYLRARQLLKASLFSLLLVACGEATTPLPSLSVLPFSGIVDKKSLANAAAFAVLLAEHQYDLDTVVLSRLVSPIFAINLPGDLAGRPVPEKTSLFHSLLCAGMRTRTDRDCVGCGNRYLAPAAQSAWG